MFKYSLIAVFLLTFSASKAQTRYKDIVFNDVTVTQNLSYSSNDAKNVKKSHLFDLYQPAGDQAAARPLIIWMHGGGFKFGSKDAKGIKLFSRDFAQRGYVCAAINYRLSKKDPLFNFGELKRSCYYAVQDVKTAVEYFKKHHAEYNIDPDKIILAGNSAGGLIAMHTAYSSNSELGAMAGVVDSTTSDHNLPHVAGVINLWGGIFNLDWLKNAKVPVVSILGDKDSIVLPRHKSAPLFGGEDIHDKADAQGIPNQLKIFYGYSHELQKHFNPFFQGGKSTQMRWLVASQFAGVFLYDTLFKQ